MIENLHFIKDLGYKGKVALENNELEEYANLMNIHWDYKKKRSSSMSNTRIDYLYNLAMKNGAISGKLIGAGNGGFLLFYCSNKKRLRESMAKEQVKELRFRIESEGTKIISV
jgi:D-glycero-alpha-D-manno-heptose-7-phosphate kinase